MQNCEGRGDVSLYVSVSFKCILTLILRIQILRENRKVYYWNWDQTSTQGEDWDPQTGEKEISQVFTLMVSTAMFHLFIMTF